MPDGPVLAAGGNNGLVKKWASWREGLDLMGLYPSAL